MESHKVLPRRTITSFLLILGLFVAPLPSSKADTAPAQTSNAETRALLSSMAHAFNDIAKHAIPAVVAIGTIKTVTPGSDEESESMGAPHLPGLAPEDQLPGVLGVPQQVIGIGSGVVIRPNGIIATNNHVIENADKITVSLDEKRKVSAHVIGADPKTDLAVIQIDTPMKNMPTLSFGNSEQSKVGDWAIAIGSPFGLNQSMSFGIISAKGRAQMGILDIEDFIQTDAAINPGSSGGPLLNSNGEVIGINTAIFSQGGGFMGIGFAIPSRIAREITDQLVDHGHVLRGYIGIMAQDLNEDLAKFFKVPAEHAQKGALVSDVAHNGPGSEAKLMPGDVIVRYDGQEVESAGQLKNYVGKTQGGSDIELRLIRRGEPTVLRVKVTQQPEELKIHKQLAGKVGRRDPNLGLAVEDLPPELTHFLKIPTHSGVLVIHVSPGSPAFDAGLSAGDIVLSVDEERLKGMKDFLQRTHRIAAGEVAVLYIQRGPDERTFVPLKG